MPQIFLVRHGETKWNVSEVFRGRRDINLNETGTRQAELLANHLKDLTIEAIYSSPLERAQATARPIAEHHGLEVNTVPGLIDFNYGIWEGMKHSEVKNKHRELYQQWLKEPHLVKIPGGESLEEVRERAKRVLDTVTAEYSGTVVLISHRVVNKVLICYMLGLDNSHFWNIRQDLGGTTVFIHQDGIFQLIKHNDISYLGKTRQSTPNDF